MSPQLRVDISVISIGGGSAGAGKLLPSREIEP